MWWGASRERGKIDDDFIKKILRKHGMPDNAQYVQDLKNKFVSKIGGEKAAKFLNDDIAKAFAKLGNDPQKKMELFEDLGSTYKNPATPDGIGKLVDDIDKGAINEGIVEAWDIISKDKALRKDASNLEKVKNFIINSGGNNATQVKAEFNDLPNADKKSWIDFLDYRSFGGRVKKAGNSTAKTLYDNIKSNKDIVPGRYKDDTRFDALSWDPDKKKDNFIEGMAGIEAENQRYLPKPISRDPSGFEFIDANGGYWDVKSPLGQYFNLDQAAGSIKEQLKIHPTVKVIFDTTWLNDSQLDSVRVWLKKNNVAMSRIVEINSNIK